MANVGRKPDYTLSAKMKTGGERGRVGAAWEQEDGSIQIKLDDFVVLQGAAIAGEKMWLTLYPPDWKKPEKEPPQYGTGPDLEDDIPF